MTRWTKRNLCVTQQELLVPFNDAVNDLVRFTPAPLELWLVRVDQNSLPIRNPESFEIKLADDVQNQPRSRYHLFTSYFQAADEFTKGAIITGRIILSIKLSQLAHIVEV